MAADAENYSDGGADPRELVPFTTDQLIDELFRRHPQGVLVARVVEDEQGRGTGVAYRGGIVAAMGLAAAADEHTRQKYRDAPDRLDGSDDDGDDDDLT